MRLIISSNKLNVAVQRIHFAVADKKMAFVSLKASKGENEDDQSKVTIASTDSSLDIYSEHACDVQGNGECHVLAKLFMDMIRQLPDGEVGLSLEGRFLVIRTQEKTHFVMKIPIITEYVWIPEQPLIDSDTFDLQSAQVLYMISQLLFSLLPDLTYRFADLGFLHQPSPRVLRLVATDTIKLSYSDIHCELPENVLTEGVCFSRKALTAIAKVCEQGASKIQFSLSKDRTVCHVKTEGYDVYVRTTHASYPDYTGLMPTKIFEPIIIDREMMIGMIKRVMLSADQTKILSFHFEEGIFTLSAHDTSDGRETAPIDYQRKPMTFGLNGELLTTILGHIMSTHISISFGGKGAPLVLYGTNEPGDCLARHIMAPISED
ncbi:MAG: hypothetical protein OXC40_07840 [Proteobacteria bacterium]|nr:hypothetical protein [Pseudomonadota bacterium]